MRQLEDISIRGKLVFIVMSTSCIALVLTCVAFIVIDNFITKPFRNMDIARTLRSIYLRRRKLKQQY